MKIIHRSYKYRIYPNVQQKILLAKHFGACRFVYNRYLNDRKDAYLEDKTSLNYYDNANSLTVLKKVDDFVWLKEVNSQSLQHSLRHLDIAYNKFFNKLSAFPTFKKRSNNQSFTVPQFFKIEDSKLFIPKFKKGIDINIHQEIEGKLLFCTLSKTPTEKYYVSITCEAEYEPYKKTGSSVGIDTGIKDLAILSDGTVYKSIKPLKQKIKRLKFKQRQLSKKKKGSNSKSKQRIIIATHHEKVSNCRKDYLHKVTTDIIKNHDIICIEDLAIKNMVKNHKLALSLNDASLGMFYTMLEYKAKWNDRTIVKIDRFFPSSKTCNNCNYINENLTLNIRQWTCPSCGEILDRDLNASKNILKQGLKILSVLGTNSDIKQKRAEALSRDKSMNPEASTPLG